MAASVLTRVRITTTIVVCITSYFLLQFFPTTRNTHVRPQNHKSQKPANDNNISKIKKLPWKVLFVSDVAFVRTCTSGFLSKQHHYLWIFNSHAPALLCCNTVNNHQVVQKYRPIPKMPSPDRFCIQHV